MDRQRGRLQFAFFFIIFYNFFVFSGGRLCYNKGFIIANNLYVLQIYYDGIKVELEVKRTKDKEGSKGKSRGQAQAKYTVIT